jgi:hypothetical protein
MKTTRSTKTTPAALNIVTLTRGAEKATLETSKGQLGAWFIDADGEGRWLNLDAARELMIERTSPAGGWKVAKAA